MAMTLEEARELAQKSLVEVEKERSLFDEMLSGVDAMRRYREGDAGWDALVHIKRSLEESRKIDINEEIEDMEHKPSPLDFGERIARLENYFKSLHDEIWSAKDQIAVLRDRVANLERKLEAYEKAPVFYYTTPIVPTTVPIAPTLDSATPLPPTPYTTCSQCGQPKDPTLLDYT
jgi:chromosome segregation ATPase